MLQYIFLQINAVLITMKDFKNPTDPKLSNGNGSLNVGGVGVCCVCVCVCVCFSVPIESLHTPFISFTLLCVSFVSDFFFPITTP